MDNDDRLMLEGLENPMYSPRPRPERGVYLPSIHPEARPSRETPKDHLDHRRVRRAINKNWRKTRPIDVAKDIVAKAYGVSREDLDLILKDPNSLIPHSKAKMKEQSQARGAKIAMQRSKIDDDISRELEDADEFDPYIGEPREDWGLPNHPSAEEIRRRARKAEIEDRDLSNDPRYF